MSSYGHFIVEVKTKDKGWQHISWKSDKTLYAYRSSDDKEEVYEHRYALVTQAYRLRDELRSGEFGSCGKSDDFTEETKKEIDDFVKEYGWYEGYFTLEQLERHINKLKKELDDFNSHNLNQAIFDEVRRIGAKLEGKEFEKPENEDEPFNEYYESDREYYEEGINMATYIANALYYIADEICGIVDSSDVRVIIVAG